MHSLSQRPIAAIVVANPRICRRTKVSGDLCCGRPYNLLPPSIYAINYLELIDLMEKGDLNERVFLELSDKKHRLVEALKKSGNFQDSERAPNRWQGPLNRLANKLTLIWYRRDMTGRGIAVASCHALTS
jgi:hypothetical protein